MAQYLDQHCLLCGEKPVRYVKTRGSFVKVCDKCRKVLSDANIAIKSDIVHEAAALQRAGEANQ